jgi:hypothetical protein
MGLRPNLSQGEISFAPFFINKLATLSFNAPYIKISFNKIKILK